MKNTLYFFSHLGDDWWEVVWFRPQICGREKVAMATAVHADAAACSSFKLVTLFHLIWYYSILLPMRETHSLAFEKEAKGLRAVDFWDHHCPQQQNTFHPPSQTSRTGPGGKEGKLGYVGLATAPGWCPVTGKCSQAEEDQRLWRPHLYRVPSPLSQHLAPLGANIKVIYL